MVAPGTTSGGHHTADFQADDGSIPIGMRAMANLLIDFLEMQAAN
jgi:metal-dependent amidase/aminoacylase/carboxypeptidase family protein